MVCLFGMVERMKKMLPCSFFAKHKRVIALIVGANVAILQGSFFGLSDER